MPVRGFQAGVGNRIAALVDGLERLALVADQLVAVLAFDSHLPPHRVSRWDDQVSTGADELVDIQPGVAGPVLGVRENDKRLTVTELVAGFKIDVGDISQVSRKLRLLEPADDGQPLVALEEVLRAIE